MSMIVKSRAEYVAIRIPASLADAAGWRDVALWLTQQPWYMIERKNGNVREYGVYLVQHARSEDAWPGEWLVRRAGEISKFTPAEFDRTFTVVGETLSVLNG